jgi:hypothetical protein
MTERPSGARGFNRPGTQDCALLVLGYSPLLPAGAGRFGWENLLRRAAPILQNRLVRLPLCRWACISVSSVM